MRVVFKNCALFTACTGEIDHTQMNNRKDIDVLLPIYSWIKYSDNYLKTWGSLWANTIQGPKSFIS